MPPLLAGIGPLLSVAGIAGATKVATGAIGAVKGIKAITGGKKPTIQTAPGNVGFGTFGSLTTPSFNLSNVGGNFSLTRGAPSALPSLGVVPSFGGFGSFGGPAVRAPSFGAPTSAAAAIDPAAVEARLRGEIRDLPGLGSIQSNISAQRGDLSAIQTRSQQLRDDVASFRSGLDIGLDRFGDVQKTIQDIRERVLGVDTSGLGALAGEVGELRGEVRPGFGRLTEAQTQAIRDRRDEAAGNLRESLSRRKILGSSFAADAQTRQDLAFQREEDVARSDAFVQELAASGQLAALQGDILNAEVSASLAKLALSGQLTAQEQSLVREQSALALQQAALTGELFALDANLLQEQARNVFIGMGLNEQEANLFALSLSQIQAEANILAQTTNRELSELGIAGNIANGVQALANDVAIANTNLAIQAAQSRGDALAGLGDAFVNIATSFGDIFGSSSGEDE